jgi:hypothetical protein
MTFAHRFASASILLGAPFVGYAAAQAKPIAPVDASWTRTYAVPWQNIPVVPDFAQEQGQENRLNGDPRFLPLLKSAFHQQQWFWRDHYRFTPVPDLVQTFIGVPGSALLDENRYITADGCVPHDCNDRGMLWIDTGSRPAMLIFVATGLVRGSDRSDPTHLWILSSKHLDFENLPPAFLTSLRRWKDDNAAHGYKEDFVLATLVQPTGEQVDLTYPTLFYKQNEPGAKQ